MIYAIILMWNSSISTKFYEITTPMTSKYKYQMSEIIANSLLPITTLFQTVFVPGMVKCGGAGGGGV